MLVIQDIWTVLETDKILMYTFFAALTLAVISLFSGWRRLDFISIIKPKVILQISLAVLIAIGLSFFEQSSYATFDISFLNTTKPLVGISRLPLYIIALAYGPSAGLLSAVLFTTVMAPNNIPSWVDAVLMLELIVLGWWSIAPSAFRKRWAAPINLFIAYILTWGTAGSALFQYQGLDASDWRVHINYHQNVIFALFISLVFLIFIGPKLYNWLFSDSRIIPKASPDTGLEPSPSLAIVKVNPDSKHPHVPFEKPHIVALERTDTRVRSLSPSPKRIAMRSLKDQDH